MIKSIKSRSKITIIAVILSTLNFFFYFSMRVIWSGIGKVLGESSSNPVSSWIIFFVYLGVCISTWVFAVIKKEKPFELIFLIVDAVLLVGLLVIIYMGAADYLFIILRHFGYCLLFTLVVAIVMYIIFYYPKSRIKDNKIVKVALFGAITTISLFKVLDVYPNVFGTKPVVYAVEDEYQIVFTTTHDATAWVEINDVKYYDLYAGTNVSETKVHKIIVPMTILDTAKEYEVNAKTMWYRGPFGAFEGNTISEEYEFHPIDSSDGLNYYSISDVHGNLNSACAAASYFGDNLDFLVMAGDIVSALDHVSDIDKINTLAHNITKGTKPVIYARGNHEVKGDAAFVLDKYVGSSNGKFYYQVKLGRIHALVLDLGEDHDDDWWEYYDTANYASYRDEQAAFIQSISPLYQLVMYDYRLLVSHIPTTFVNSRGDFNEVKDEWTETLNTLDIDMAVSGHQHELVPFTPGLVTPNSQLTFASACEYGSGKMNVKAYYTDFNYPGFMVSARSKTQFYDKDDIFDSAFTGLATTVDFDDNTETSFYTNNDAAILEDIVYPYSDVPARTNFVYNLSTKQLV